MGKDEPGLPFWEQKTLAQMSRAEWESLCDGCGLCCLHKLENEYDLSIHYTDVACRLLDRKSCQCGDYPNRRTLVPDCVELDASNIGDMHWLPRSCAYRLRWEDKPLPAWHYLVCGDRKQVHRSGISRAGRMRSEDDIPEDDWEKRIIFRI